METHHKIPGVDVETNYVEEQSGPWGAAVRVRLHYHPPQRRREAGEAAEPCWIITDANGKVQEARGDGVVGEQPHLKPGQGFRYSSGTMIETPVGAMQGTYQMVADDGEALRRPIAPFRLAIPGILSKGSLQPMTTWAIGDIQGCHDELRTLVAQLGFRADRDQLGSRAIS